MKDDEYPDPETEELWQLALNTPTRFSIMTITDMRTGVSVEVDQSMDSTFGAEKSSFKSFLSEFLNIYFAAKNREYNGELDGKTKVRINNLLIDFGNYEGRLAWNWLVRYVNIVVKLMNDEGVIDIKKIEEELHGRNQKSADLQQQV